MGMHPWSVEEFLALNLDLFPLQSFTGGNPAIVASIVVAFLVGILGAYLGYRRYQSGKLIAATETAPIGSITPGRVGITGTVRPVDETLTAKFTDDECVWYGYSITDHLETEEEDDEGNTVHEIETRERGDGTKSVEFYVEDDTGTALIDVEDGVKYSISSENKHRFRKKRHQPIEDPEFTYEDQYLPSGTKQRSYRQSMLPVGEKVFVMGSARAAPTDENTATVVMSTDEETDTFIVSDERQDELASGKLRSGLLIILLSLAMSAVTLYLLVSDFVLV
nr:GIDE domain-containing protein [Halovivax sp. KZCA124]